jgi:hypothetical protein
VPPPKDDRILPFTRAVAAVVIAILVLAFVVLSVLPGDTDHRFAWTIHPSMTAMVMVAGYGSALYFFVRVLAERRWHRVALGFIPTTVFTWMMLGTTILQWPDFRHGSMPFLLWFWVYLLTPILVPLVWMVNRRHDPHSVEPGERPFDPRLRAGMVAGGAFLVAIAAWYLWPSAAVAVWPWGLRVLTARTMAAFIALPGVAWLAIAADGRWSASRIVPEIVAIGLVLLLVAVVRDWTDIQHDDVLTFVYLLGLLGTLGCIVAPELAKRSAASTTIDRSV